MADRTIVFAQNGRHSLRGLQQVNPAEFLAYQDALDALTYIADFQAYLDGATITSVTRTLSGLVSSNESNTTTRVTQRLAGTGHVDIKLNLSSGDTEEFRIVINERAATAASSQPAVIPDPMAMTYTTTRDPTTTDDSVAGNFIGQLWENTTNGRVWCCKTNAVSAARWTLISNEVYFAPDYGAKADGTTDDSTAIQAAIDAANTAGGGIVLLPVGTLLVGTTLTARNGVLIRGAHMNATILKAKTNLNAAVIRSLNYATLTGQNKWLTSDGVVHGFGLEDLQIDGNKANQSATANGVELYAKRLTFRNVLIRDCRDIGLVTEAAAISAQTDYTDLPEGSIGPLFIRNCGSHGWQMRGPHDAVVNYIGVNQCGGDGMRIEVSGTYSGVCDVTRAHIYANTGYGVYIGAAAKFSHLISESNGKEGAYLDSGNIHIGMLETYTNCSASGTFETVLTTNANSAVIGTANIRNLFNNTKGGIQIASDKCQIRARIDGTTAASTGIGCEILAGADYNNINVTVTGFSGAGGIGLKTNSGGAGNYNQITAHLNDCKTLWNNAATGVHSGYIIRGRAEATQTFFSGNGPNATDSRERWDVVGDDSGGTTYLSEVRKTSGATFDLNSTAEQSVSIGCSEIGWAGTPELEDVSFGLTSSGTNTTFVIQYFKLKAISTTQADFILKCSTAAGVAQTANVVMQARL